MVNTDFSFKVPKIEKVSESTDKKTATFVVEPLERGYGLTLGSSLRRIMLSSLSGTSVTGIKIEGVLHEFSSIPGVHEDVSEIIMNIKQLVIKNVAQINEPTTARIEFEGEGIVHASDIQIGPDYEIINPDLVIAHLNTPDSKLYMDLSVSNGRGYISAEKNKSDDLPVGVISIDSIYTPIERVNMSVTNTRVGHDIDLDKLTLDITTNGSITPEDALSLSAKTLRDQLSVFIDLSDAVEIIEDVVVEETPDTSEILSMKIEDMELSVRSFNCLKRAGINTVEDLCNKTESEMMKIRNLGNKSLVEVHERLEAMGLSLRKDSE
ncbi:MAG: DNA-directed RNA polymerase subunit alpha [Lachnospiraceae bacterium]|nr:DNA-directed RNA polymerase subunit alpha [Lachnospiraceae bacterium]MDY2956426.1 DNA-directed RNA polymerase subunit alpha [Lachnospiraceae bacterium]